MMEAFIFISMLLTGPLIVAGAYVSWYFRLESHRTLMKKSGSRGPADYLNLGVELSFLGKMLDAIYWAIPWTLHYQGSDWAAFFFMVGCIPNILFRQSMGIAAGACHIIAAAKASKNDQLIVCFVRDCIISALLMTVILKWEPIRSSISFLLWFLVK